MEVITKGSIESLLVPLRDRLGNVSSLSGVTNPGFTVRKKEDNALIQTSVWATDPDYPMTAICLIDTSVSGYVAGDEYKLYITYTSGSEVPILGPIEFRVEDD